MSLQNDFFYWTDTDKYVLYDVNFAHYLGVTESIMLGKLLNLRSYWEKHGGLNEHGEFFTTVPQMEEYTGIKEKAQRAAMKKLEAKGIIKVTARGLPAKRYFYISMEGLQAAAAEARDFVQNKIRQNGGTDNGAAEQPKNAANPQSNQIRQNGGTVSDETAEQYPPFEASNTNINTNINTNKKREEEEEEAAIGQLVYFLVSKGHEKADAKAFAERAAIKGLLDADRDLVLEAIRRAYEDFLAEKCDMPYYYAVKKLENLQKARKAVANVRPLDKQTAGRKKAIRTERLPEWYGKEDKPKERTPEEQEALERDAEALRARLLSRKERRQQNKQD